MEIQLRSESTGLHFVNTFESAFDLCHQDQSIWKISFDFKKTNFRLLKENDEMEQGSTWINRPMKILDARPWVSDEFVELPKELKNKLLNIGFKVK